jgi:hypothetical protein
MGFKARERHPILKHFQNDWATEEIVKQYIKNKRRHGYKKGFLEPPTQYAYLKANSAKRDPSAPRGKRADAARTAKKAAVKKAVAKKNSTSAKAKGKKKMVVVDDDDDESMSEGGKDD